MRQRLGRVVATSLSLSALVLSMFGAVGVTPPASSQTPTGPHAVREYLGEEYGLDLSVGGNDPLCLGEPATFQATIQQYGVYQDVEERWYVPRPSPYRVNSGTGTLGLARLSREVSNPAILNFHGTTQYLGMVSLINYDSATAEKVGSTDVTYRVVGPGVAPAEWTVRVEVTECDYEVHTFSIWHVNANRNIVASSSIDTVLRRLGTSQRLIQLVAEGVESENAAISFPAGGCPVVETISKTPATVLGYVDVDSYTLGVDIEYGAVTAGTEVNCGEEGGSASDPGTPARIRFEMSPRGGSDWDNHVLHAPGLGDFSGTTYITVIPIPR